MRVLALLRQALSTARRDESGQSLIVVISSMAVLLGVAGFGIDTANWMVHHHDAQVVADSAALAAAQCLAQPNQPTTIEVNGQQVTLQACGSDPSTETSNAATVAVEYAAANGLTITPSDVTFSGKVVTVAASTSTPSIFARVLGIGTMSQSARAGAAFTSNPGQCTTAGSTCDFMFANSSVCTTGSDALNLSTQGSSSVNGNIQTNGNLVASGTGNAGGVDGTGNYGPGSGCESTTGGNHDPWKTGDPTNESSLLSWPIDYSKDFQACSAGSSTNPCDAQNYPAYCTNIGSNIVLNDTIPADNPQQGRVYCAVGTGATVNPSDPSTWNGSVTINMSGSNTIEDTFIGGTITYSGAGSDTFSACGWTATGFSASTCQAGAPLSTANYPIFYAVGNDPNPTSCAAGTDPSTTCAFYMHSNGNFTLDGDMFVENGTASFDFHGNQSAANTFIEANTISASLDGNFNGDGPSPGTNGTNGGSGAVSLVQ